ncbi:ROK family transcriptional regulator [Devosia sp. CAU 1758]
MSRTEEPTQDVFESGRRGLSHNGVRRANEKAVLTVVAFNSGASNAEISRLSQLAPQTVSAILGDLERGGLIRRGPVLRGRRGQPATPILLNENGGLAIGVEIGWRHLEVVMLNMHARVMQRRHVDYAYPDAAIIVETIAGIADEFVAGLTPPQAARLLDLGVAMPGNLAENLHILDAPQKQIAQWRTLDLADALWKRTSLAVTLFNDGNAGCWAELIALQPPRPANVIYLLVSHFVAAGIVGDGTLWEGPTGTGAELGSILISRAGEAPEVAHRIASVWALRERLTAGGHPASFPPGSPPGSGEERELSGWVKEAAHALAQVIYNATAVVEQPLVVIDSMLSREIAAALVDGVTAALELLPERTVPTPRVVMGQLGHLAPAIGAAELPLFRRYF